MMLSIIENPEFTINVLDVNSIVSLTMVLVDTNNSELIFKTEFKGYLSEFINKYSDLIPTYTTVEVYLDMYVDSHGTMVHFATISSENELYTQFQKLNNLKDFYRFDLEDGGLEINVIEESVMKGIVSDTWDGYSLTYEDLQSQINKLNALVVLNEQKLKTYKTLSSDLVIKGTNMSELEGYIIKKPEFVSSIEQIRQIIEIYERLSDKITLSSTEFKKYNAAKTIYKSANNYYKLLTGNELPKKG